MPETLDTIAAIATPNGRGGIGVVRVSGPAVPTLAVALCGALPRPRRARRTTFRAAAGTPIDHGLALFFPGPRSFTGEDVLELHAHGSPVVLAALVRRACELGARPARAGEFSERAFLNGKLDLLQAEAVADLIAARSELQARAAVRSLEGEFSRQVQALAATLVRLRVEVEAAIDFAEDAAESGAPSAIERLFAAAVAQHAALLAAAGRGVRLTDGLTAVLVGAPNVGKSSLLNALAGSDRAIVTAVPGTTRDVLRETLGFDGVEVTLVDTAGLREAGDAIEGEGIRRARAELARADVVLAVVEHAWVPASWPALAGVPVTAPRIVVVNKIDLDGLAPARLEAEGDVLVRLSARTSAGLDLLRAELRRMAGGAGAEGAFSARARHLDALRRTRAHLERARDAYRRASPELVAEDLRLAQQALGEITGAFTNEDLLGAIFSTFCIGK